MKNKTYPIFLFNNFCIYLYISIMYIIFFIYIFILIIKFLTFYMKKIDYVPYYDKLNKFYIKSEFYKLISILIFFYQMQLIVSIIK